MTWHPDHLGPRLSPAWAHLLELLDDHEWHDTARLGASLAAEHDLTRKAVATLIADAALAGWIIRKMPTRTTTLIRIHPAVTNTNWPH